jgi:glycosyltransferase involved in cell wall biosynthesis
VSPSSVLFALYHDFTANSALHVCQLASELTALGVDCTVAVPNGQETQTVLPRRDFAVLEFAEALTQQWDVVHAWTPREVVRTFCASVQRKSLFIHLEDNEPYLLAHLGSGEEVPDGLSHPRRSREFLAQADGITVVIDRLAEFAPPGIPVLEISPSCDMALFQQRPRNEQLREQFLIAPETTVIAYTGNVHAANVAEVRSLYLSMALLNREGVPGVLIRSGKDHVPAADEILRKSAVELGRVDYRQIPAILAAADFLVQPGRPGTFNDYRVPSKLPEFFSAGRPVILPATNLGLQVCHGEEAWVLPKADAVSIADAIRFLRSDADLCQRLSQGGRRFLERRPTWAENARKVLDFYSTGQRSANSNSST